MSQEKKPTDNFNSTADLTGHPGFQSSLSIASKDVVNHEKAYNPFENRSVEHPNTVIGSILHLLKACLGTGILAMPAAFKNAGLGVGVIGTIVAGFICTHAVHILVKVSQELCVEAKIPSMGFAETCGAVFKYGPKPLQKWGRFFEKFFDISMALTYISVLCVYVVFIGSSFKEVCDNYFPHHQLSIQTYCALTLVPLVLVSQIRNLKYLVPFSALANVLIVVVYGITMYYMFSDMHSISGRDIVAPVTQWPLFFSTVIFAMEGVGIIFPIENEMAKPKKFLGCPGVLNTAMIIVISLFGIFGFFGYLKYGDEVKGSITLNLPEDSVVAQSAKVLMAIVIYLSFTLQMYVVMEMVTRFLNKRQSRKFENLIQISIRTGIVIVVVAVAAAFPNLEMVIGFVGAIFFSTLGILTPAVVETVYRWERGLGRCNYILIKNVIIGIFAIFALVSGSYVSVIGIMADFNKGNHTHTE